MNDRVTRRDLCLGATAAVVGVSGRGVGAHQPADPPPITDPPGVLERLAKEFPRGTELRKSEHFLVVYDTPAVWARSRVNLLEMTHDRFYKSLRGLGFELTPLRHRLVCVLFARHAGFIDYARRRGVVNMEWSGGFYSSGDNRVAFFANQTKPKLAESGEQIAKAQADLAKIDRQIAAATNAQRHGEAERLRSVRAKIVARIGEVQTRHARVVGLNNLSSTIHEAAHQLAFNSGLQRRGRAYPLWVSEGLATAFETTHPAGGYGPTHDNWGRRRALELAKARRELIPWEAFVGMMGVPDGEAARKAAYAQSWALMHVLMNREPGRVRAYLKGLGEARRPDATAAARLGRFTEAMGVRGDWGGDVLAWLHERYGG